MADERDKWAGVNSMIDQINHAVVRAVKDGDNVKFYCPPNIALTIADALTHLKYMKAPLFDGMQAVERNIIMASEMADEAMQDAVTRASIILSDLELLLTRFIGRPETSIEEIRKMRSSAPLTSRPASKRAAFQVSDELRRSIRTGKIGDPRKPGQEE